MSGKVEGPFTKAVFRSKYHTAHPRSIIVPIVVIITLMIMFFIISGSLVQEIYPVHNKNDLAGHPHHEFIHSSTTL